jgi:hypothetical protein
MYDRDGKQLEKRIALLQEKDMKSHFIPEPEIEVPEKGVQFTAQRIDVEDAALPDQPGLDSDTLREDWRSALDLPIHNFLRVVLAH